MDAATLDGVTLKRGGETVAASAAVDPEDVDARTAVITPDEALAADTEYQVVIGAGVRDVTGNSVSRSAADADLPDGRRTSTRCRCWTAGGRGRALPQRHVGLQDRPGQAGRGARWYMPENTGGWDTGRARKLGH